MPKFSSNVSTYIAISPLRDGTAGHFRHLVHVYIQRKQIHPLTHGKYEVNRIVHWDQQHSDFVYFLGTPEGRPSQQHLYRVAAQPPKYGVSLKAPQCLTCPNQELGNPTNYGDNNGNADAGVTQSPVKVGTNWDDSWEDPEVVTLPPNPQTTPMPPPPSSAASAASSSSSFRRRKPDQGHINPTPPPPACLYHNVEFAPSPTDYLLVECLGPGIPTTAIYKINHDTPERPLQFLYAIRNNSHIQEKISKVAMPQVRSFPIVISGGYHAQVRLLLPPGLRQEEITKYPLMLHVYSGPGTQLVTDKWKIGWNTYLASNKDYIVAEIDGRGSSGQGYQLLHEVYRRLGTVEVSDQLEVAEYLRDTFHFVDSRRMGVWGWSYGGYIAGLALAHPMGMFQCGVSVSPVSSWKLYGE